MTTATIDSGVRARPTPFPGAETPWDVLERFGLALMKAEQAQEQIWLSLNAVRDSLGADAVYWHAGVSSDPPQVCGTGVATSVCKAVTERLLADRPSSGSVIGHVGPDDGGPAAAALVRMSRSRGAWLVALAFGVSRHFSPADLKVMLLARRILLNHRQQAQTYEQLKDSLLGMVRCLTGTIDAKDPYTWGHSERVARIAVRVGRQLQLSSAALNDLYLAGMLHDIGKIGIRDSVLQKPGGLTAEEFQHIQQHPVIGDRLVSNITALNHLRAGVRNHHERYDGTGYPDKLRGEDIPLLARILSVADSCDAMMSPRPYRPALPSSQIDVIMAGGAGTQWDAKIVEAFLACRHELYPICQRGLGDSVYAAVERALNAGRDDQGSALQSFLQAAP